LSERVPVLSVVGRSNSGKTTLIEKLLPWLTARGWRVGTLKHDVHGFTMDHEGKDTHRHFEAGAERVLIAGPRELAFRERVAEHPEREPLIMRFFEGLDLVITEGYKTGDWPKIEVVRAARSSQPICLQDGTLKALATDVNGSWPVPAFALDDAAAIGGWIETQLLGEKG
jgi:molybdopterin-guanine dinucleotide biosynthesis protein MobB